MARKRYFEWISGEDKGNVVILESITDYDGKFYYNFDDGETCAEEFISPKATSVAELRGKFMVEIDSPSNPWTFEIIEPKKYHDYTTNETFDIPTYHDIYNATGNGQDIGFKDSNVGSEKPVPPRVKQRLEPLPNYKEYSPKPVEKRNDVQKTTLNDKLREKVNKNPDPDSDTKKTNSGTTDVIEETECVPKKENKIFEPAVKQVPVSPIKNIVDKCKKHPTEVELTLTINLPAVSTYAFVSSEFADGATEFINCIISDIDVSSIINQLQISLIRTYEDNVKRDDPEN